MRFWQFLGFCPINRPVGRDIGVQNFWCRRAGTEITQSGAGAGLGLGHGLKNYIFSFPTDSVMHNNTWQSGGSDAVLRCSEQGC